MNLLFVYGSLRKGFHNNYLLEKARFICYCKTQDEFYMIGRLNNELDVFEDGREFSYPPRKFLYPYIYREDLRSDCELTNIIGELYEIDNNVLEILDIHEGHPTIYERQETFVIHNTKLIKSFIYVLNCDEIKKEIASNDKLFIPVRGDWCSARF